MNKYRIILTIVIAACIINGWWFVALPLGLIGFWRFPYYLEFIVAGIAYDSLFGFTRETSWAGYLGTLITFVGAVIILLLKKVMR